MKIYIISDWDNTIIKAYTEKEKAEAYIIEYIKLTYKQDKDNIYIDNYDNFILYNFKYNNSYLTFKINTTTLN